MPLVKGDKGETHDRPVGRIRGTRKLLTSAALIMSVFLITSSFVTATLIPKEAFEAPVGTAGHNATANGRALAYLAYEFFGSGFGTLYDLSTIAILWFAGSSALAGLLNIVPRYLPRYGMAPNWARATAPRHRLHDRGLRRDQSSSRPTWRRRAGRTPRACWC